MGTILALCLAMTGCSNQGTVTYAPTSQPVDSSAGHDQLRNLATSYIRRGLIYPDYPAVRAQAVEAIELLRVSDADLLLRESMSDDQAGVRFCAIMAIGRLKDAGAQPKLKEMLKDPDPSVRVAVYFALERLGDKSHRLQWRDLLRWNDQPTVRRNAAMALGQLNDPSVTRLLQSAANRDKDESVRLQAIEGLASLGDKDSIGRLIQYAFARAGGTETFAVLALGKVKDERVIPALRTRLDGSAYLESRLAAARSLAEQGLVEGYQLAIDSLAWNRPIKNLADDPPENQVMRAQSMAAMALGQMGDPRALEALSRRMQLNDDARVQLACATAILMILDR